MRVQLGCQKNCGEGSGMSQAKNLGFRPSSTAFEGQDASPDIWVTLEIRDIFKVFISISLMLCLIQYTKEKIKLYVYV